MKRVALSIAGVFLILLGIVGLFLPILQGIALIFLGLSLLAPGFAKRLQRKMLKRFSKKDIVYFKQWKKVGVKAGFTTRHFPVFMQRTDALKEAAVQAQFLEHFSGKFAVLNQVHSDGIAVLDDASAFPKPGFYHYPSNDAVVTNIKGLTLLVFTADCLPIFLQAGGWIGLVHAGWKGAKLGIAAKAVFLLSERSGVRPSQIKAIFGPCIRKKNYEVGEEFLEIFPETTSRIKGKPHFDLAAENKRQLLDAGLVKGSILDLELDTFSENEDFYSFRKEKESAGRLVSFVTKSDFS